MPELLGVVLHERMRVGPNLTVQANVRAANGVGSADVVATANKGPVQMSFGLAGESLAPFVGLGLSTSLPSSYGRASLDRKGASSGSAG